MPGVYLGIAVACSAIRLLGIGAGSSKLTSRFLTNHFRQIFENFTFQGCIDYVHRITISFSHIEDIFLAYGYFFLVNSDVNTTAKRTITMTILSNVRCWHICTVGFVSFQLFIYLRVPAYSVAFFSSLINVVWFVFLKLFVLNSSMWLKF